MIDRPGSGMQDFSEVKEIISMKDFYREMSEYIEESKKRSSAYLPYARKFKVKKNSTVTNIYIQITHSYDYTGES